MAGSNTVGKWRCNPRQNDGLIEKLTKASQVGDHVYCDPGPGVRVSGILKEWEKENLAVVEIDPDDRGIHIPLYEKTVLSIMKIPVVR